MGVGLSSFSLRKTLSQAYDSINTNLLGSGNLGGDIQVGFIVLGSSLGVADEDPVDTEVFNLLSADFSGEGAEGCGAHVLAGDFNIIFQNGFDCRDVDIGWGNNNINFGGVEFSLIEDVSDELFDRLKAAITFPITADNHFSLRSLIFCRSYPIHILLSKEKQGTNAEGK